MDSIHTWFWVELAQGLILGWVESKFIVLAIKLLKQWTGTFWYQSERIGQNKDMGKKVDHRSGSLNVIGLQLSFLSKEKWPFER